MSTAPSEIFTQRPAAIEVDPDELRRALAQYRGIELDLLQGTPEVVVRVSLSIKVDGLSIPVGIAEVSSRGLHTSMVVLHGHADWVASDRFFAIVIRPGEGADDVFVDMSVEQMLYFDTTDGDRVVIYTDFAPYLVDIYR